MKMQKPISVAILLMLLSSCAVHMADSAKWFPEATGTTAFSMDSFSNGSYRLGPAGSMAAMGGKTEANLLITTGKGNDKYKSGTDNIPLAVLDVISSAPSGDAVSYYYLGYAAENLQYRDAAFEYYSLAKLLYDYQRQPGVDENLWRNALASGDEVIISECGYRYRNWNGWEEGYCIKNLRQRISLGIRNTSE
jgi:hypothetical protein|tara:strand:- start:268 stop:846 length:579 start_codon:yes stop_codon:yes gene_type:complete